MWTRWEGGGGGGGGGGKKRAASPSTSLSEDGEITCCTDGSLVLAELDEPLVGRKNSSASAESLLFSSDILKEQTESRKNNCAKKSF